MEYVKSVRQALRPRSLFASLLPVGISLSLLRVSHGTSLLRADTAAALAFAALVQLLFNLNNVYGAFRRTLRPVAEGDGHGHGHGHGHSHGAAPPPRIVINLLSQTQVQRWSYMLFALLVATALAAHVAQGKSVAATAGALALAALALAYCRRQARSALPAAKAKAARGAKPAASWALPGLEEAVVAAAAGPLAILGTHLYVADELAGAARPWTERVPWSAVIYALAVLLFVSAFEVVQSAKDAPLAQMMPAPAADASLALRLGPQRTFQTFLLLLVTSYALACVAPLALGHLPNLLLLLTLERVKDLSDAFREGDLHDLPDRVAALGAFLGVALIASIHVSAIFILGK